MEIAVSHKLTEGTVKMGSLGCLWGSSGLSLDAINRMSVGVVALLVLNDMIHGF